jgi:TPR repeat protein
MRQHKNSPARRRLFTRGGLLAVAMSLLLAAAAPVPARAEDKTSFVDAIAQGMKQGSASGKYYQALLLRARDSDKSLSLLEQSADENYVPAQIMMGALYMNPHDMKVPHDDTKAVYWLQKAYAQTPDSGALLYYLGQLYGAGRGGLKADKAKQFDFFTKSAQSGFLPAMHALATEYLSGDGTKKDVSQAVYWYKKAAANGMAESRFNLGLLYMMGDDVPQDYTQAAKWLQLSAADSFPPAQYWLGVLYRDGHGLHQDRKEAAKWFEKAAQSNMVLAQWDLGDLYGKGLGVGKDPVKAYFWHKLSTLYGNTSFTARLSLMAARLKLSGDDIKDVDGQVMRWKSTHPDIFGQ